MIILAHRGIDLPKSIPENTPLAFRNCLSQGFGLETDINFLKNELVFSHDTQPTKSNCNFEQLIQLIHIYHPPLVALHYKGIHQTTPNNLLIYQVIQKYPKLLPIFLIFDLKPITAKFFRHQFPNINLGISVSHSYDIKRFNHLTNQTLFSPSMAIYYRNLYNYVWLDEWDHKSHAGKKTLYNQKNFNSFKKNNFQVALVTPELHSQTHPQAANGYKLKLAFHKISKLKPDIICTDHPHEFSHN